MSENKSLIFYVENGKINKPTHYCWSKIAQEFDNLISAKYVYTIALEDRFKFMKELKSDDIVALSQNLTNTLIDNPTSIISS